MVDKSIVAMGTHFVVRFMRYQNCFPAEDYLTGAGEAVKARMLVLARYFANHGRLTTEENGHWLHGDYAELFEFKPHGHRLMAFIDGTSVYLACGAPKRRKKAQEGDYKRAITLRDDYFANKNEAKNTKAKNAKSKK